MQFVISSLSVSYNCFSCRGQHWAAVRPLAAAVRGAAHACVHKHTHEHACTHSSIFHQFSHFTCYEGTFMAAESFINSFMRAALHPAKELSNMFTLLSLHFTEKCPKLCTRLKVNGHSGVKMCFQTIECSWNYRLEGFLLCSLNCHSCAWMWLSLVGLHRFKWFVRPASSLNCQRYWTCMRAGVRQFPVERTSAPPFRWKKPCKKTTSLHQIII